MNLINFNHREDFGDDWSVQILNTGKYFPTPFKRRSLIQISVSWNDYPGWPYLQITFGSNGLVGVLFWVYKFGFDLDLFSTTWNFDYLKNLDEKEDN